MKTMEELNGATVLGVKLVKDVSLTKLSGKVLFPKN
jgi:hypothetical protein